MSEHHHIVTWSCQSALISSLNCVRALSYHHLIVSERYHIATWSCQSTIISPLDRVRALSFCHLIVSEHYHIATWSCRSTIISPLLIMSEHYHISTWSCQSTTISQLDHVRALSYRHLIMSEHWLLFLHASAEVRGENTLERKVASNWSIYWRYSNWNENNDFFFHEVENIVSKGKQKKSWLPVLSPFHAMFSERWFLGIMGKELTITTQCQVLMAPENIQKTT